MVYPNNENKWQIPVDERSKARVCCRSLTGSNPTVVMDVCCQVEVPAMDRSLVQRSPTDCGVSLCVI
jgi:hypothetical protein